jgi:hypothetical protein
MQLLVLYQSRCKNAASCLLLKDKDLIGANEMMGEYFLGFQQITRGDSSVDMNDLEQMILPLTKPLEKGKINLFK